MVDRTEKVFLSGQHVGDLSVSENEVYTFRYLDEYVASGQPGISALLDPQKQAEYESHGIPLPAFENLLPEHNSRELLAKSLGVSRDDYMSLLVGASHVLFEAERSRKEAEEGGYCKFQ